MDTKKSKVKYAPAQHRQMITIASGTDKIEFCEFEGGEVICTVDECSCIMQTVGDYSALTTSACDPKTMNCIENDGLMLEESELVLERQKPVIDVGWINELTAVADLESDVKTPNVKNIKAQNQRLTLVTKEAEEPTITESFRLDYGYGALAAIGVTATVTYLCMILRIGDKTSAVE